LQPKPPLKQLNGVNVCQICGDDDVGVTLEASEFFMVCNECLFLICQPCYEHKTQNMDETHLYHHHQGQHWVGFLINFLLDIITSTMIEKLLTCAHFINFHLKNMCSTITNGNVLCEIFGIMNQTKIISLNFYIQIPCFFYTCLYLLMIWGSRTNSSTFYGW
jgi:hypothetical protein